MKEIDTSADDVKGHLKLGFDDFRRDIYRLFTHFQASAALAEYANKDTGAYYTNLQQGFEEIEIQTLLLGLAVRIRILDEAYREKWHEGWSKTVGRLFKNSAVQEHIPLSLREACNKIIHARIVNFCRTGLAEYDEVVLPLIPTVILYGSHSRSPIVWKSELNVNAFIDSALAIAEDIYGPLLAKRAKERITE